MNACEKCLIYNDVIPGKEYSRTKKEAEGWPNKRMPIVLCGRHAKKRKPLTEKQIDTIMKKIIPSTLLMLCLFVVGCSAQTFVEALPSISPVNSVLTTGPNKSIIGVDPSVFKGAKGDKGDTGAQGIQGVPGVKGEKGDSADTKYIIAGGWQENLRDGREIATGYTGDDLQPSFVVSGTVKLYEGTLLIKYAYTDNLGVDKTGSFEVTKTGSFSTGLVGLYARPKTLIRINTEVTGNVFYDIVHKFYGL